MKKVLSVTAMDARHGFGLAGIRQCAVDPDELRETLARAMADGGNGLLIIDERLISGMDEDRLREMERSWSGVVVILPSPGEGPTEVEDYATRLIRRAVGYHVRIRL